jgi:excisionase family DNA binding protein
LGAELHSNVATKTRRDGKPIAPDPGRLHVAGQADALRLALSLKDAGLALGVSKFTVRRMISGGKLRGVQVGRRWVVPVFELQRFLGASSPAVSQSEHSKP